MTDRLTDEQVRELWARCERHRLRWQIQRCWQDASVELGHTPHHFSPELWEKVRARSMELAKERGLPWGPDLIETAPSWAELEPLLAEVRRARGME